MINIYGAFTKNQLIFRLCLKSTFLKISFPFGRKETINKDFKESQEALPMEI
jgi:hypothetical protein